MNLECKYLWEYDLKESDRHVLICLEIVNVMIDENYLNENIQGRYGKQGLIYNIHYPINPENFNRKGLIILAF